MKPQAKVVLSLCILILVVAGGYLITKKISSLTGKGILTTGESELDRFAKCLTEQNIKMYGAYWCKHSQNQKQMFGSSFQYIDYIECDPKGKNANPEACIEAGIPGYPTWIINGKQYPGEQTLKRLSDLSKCDL